MHESLPAHLRPPQGQFYDPVNPMYGPQRRTHNQGGGMAEQQQQQQQHEDVPSRAARKLEYTQNTPMQPMYSVLPLIRENEYIEVRLRFWASSLKVLPSPCACTHGILFHLTHDTNLSIHI